MYKKPTSQDDGITYKLVACDSLFSSQSVEIQFILENKSDKSLFFLNWYTPFEGFNSDMFRVFLDDEQIRYTGRMVKRGNQSIKDYLLIEPGGSLDTVIDLSSVYNLKNQGEYRIEYRGEIYDYMFAEEMQSMEEFFPRSPESHKMIAISGNSLNIEVSEFQ